MYETILFQFIVNNRKVTMCPEFYTSVQPFPVRLPEEKNRQFSSACKSEVSVTGGVKHKAIIMA